MAFFEFRHQVNTIQALMAVDTEDVSKQMVKWAIGLARETIVLVEGVVQQPKELVKSTTVQDAEVKILRASYKYLLGTVCLIFGSVTCRSRSPDFTAHQCGGCIKAADIRDGRSKYFYERFCHMKLILRTAKGGESAR